MKKVALLSLLLITLALGQDKAPKEIKLHWEKTINVPDTCKVYTGSRGGRYIWLKNKKGESYKYYLPKEKL